MLNKHFSFQSEDDHYLKTSMWSWDHLFFTKNSMKTLNENGAQQMMVTCDHHYVTCHNYVKNKVFQQYFLRGNFLWSKNNKILGFLFDFFKITQDPFSGILFVSYSLKDGKLFYDFHIDNFSIQFLLNTICHY